MLDSDDRDFALLTSLATSGPLGVAFLVIAIVVFFVVCSNESDCKKMTCEGGTAPVLVENRCLCVKEAR